MVLPPFRVPQRAALAALLTLACGTPSNDFGPISAPGDFAVQQHPQLFNHVLMSWTRPPELLDGYELEVRGGGSTQFVKATASLIPQSFTQADLYFGPDWPEAMQMQFRIRAVRGQTSSPYSDVADYFRGLWPAVGVSVTLSTYPSPTLRVTWTRRSTAATGIRLERSVIAADGSRSPWTVLAGVAPADQSYVDSDLAAWASGTSFAYRVTYTLGTLESMPTEGVGPKAP